MGLDLMDDSEIMENVENFLADISEKAYGGAVNEKE